MKELKDYDGIRLAARRRAFSFTRLRTWPALLLTSRSVIMGLLLATRRLLMSLCRTSGYNVARAVTDPNSGEQSAVPLHESGLVLRRESFQPRW
ncbi:hypothetical protein Dimus_037339, partial [Dionaea muscipula]